MTTFRIAVLAGDGIGLEVMPEALRVLSAALDGSRLNGSSTLRLDFQHHAAGANEYLRSGPQGKSLE